MGCCTVHASQAGPSLALLEILNGFLKSRVLSPMGLKTRVRFFMQPLLELGERWDTNESRLTYFRRKPAYR